MSILRHNVSRRSVCTQNQVTQFLTELIYRRMGVTRLGGNQCFRDKDVPGVGDCVAGNMRIRHYRFSNNGVENVNVTKECGVRQCVCWVGYSNNVSRDFAADVGDVMDGADDVGVAHLGMRDVCVGE